MVCTICRVRRREIVNFMTPTPRGGNCGVICVYLMYFLKTLLFYSEAWFRQTKYVVIMTKEESTKIVNVMILVTRVLVLGRGHIIHIGKMHYFFFLEILYSQT